jgi:hypothetical protein
MHHHTTSCHRNKRDKVLFRHDKKCTVGRKHSVLTSSAVAAWLTNFSILLKAPELHMPLILAGSIARHEQWRNNNLN